MLTILQPIFQHFQPEKPKIYVVVRFIARNNIKSLAKMDDITFVEKDSNAAFQKKRIDLYGTI